MVRNEAGSEVVQFVVALPVLLLVVFASLQVGGMMLTTSKVSSDIVRACRQMDTAGLSLAANKDVFVKEAVLGAVPDLVAENLAVSGTTCMFEEKDHSYSVRGEGTMTQREQRAAVSFDVTYTIPSLVDLSGLSGQVLERRVEFVQVGDRIVEVEMREE